LNARNGLSSTEVAEAVVKAIASYNFLPINSLMKAKRRYWFSENPYHT
jgi:hypothetical protein